MLKNYFKIALRNLVRQRGYAFINITGLAVSMACCLFIFLFVRHERSYDRFHDHAERIARVSMTWVFDETELPVAATTTMPGPWLTDELPDVLNYVRFRRASSAIVRVNDETFKETGLVYADSSLFDVFSFPLVRGEARTALARPNTVVLTRHMAQKYFGERDPIGQILLLNDTDTYEVTGVMADVPDNSHIQFDLAVSFASLPEATERTWNNSAYHTYLLLTNPDAVPRVQAAVPGLLRDWFSEGFANTPRLHITPLTEVYLHSDLAGEWSPEGDIRYVYIFSAIALLILLIACINYMNLATARAVDRAREIGLRKVLGAYRFQLFGQFIGEAALMTGVGFLLAAGLLQVSLPVFNTLSGKTLIWDNAALGSLLLGLWLIVSVLAGIYPALVLSGFRPASVLKGRFRTSSSGTWLRKGLVVFQFAISIFLIASTFVIYSQLQFIQHKKLGYDKEHVVVLSVDRALRPQLGTIKQALAANGSVQQVATTSDIPIQGASVRTFNAGEAEEERQLINTLEVDDSFIGLLGLTLLSGQGFTEADMPTQNGSDELRTIILNEAAAHHFGWSPEEAVGKTLFSAAMGGAPCEVKGVVEDFHFDSLHKPIEPLVLLAGRNVYFLMARLAPGNVQPALADLRSTWTRVVPHRPFEYQFLDQEFQAVYQSEQRVGYLFTAFAVLAILVACLGLFGLATFSAEQRTKEIGIRKVLGASVPSILLLLSKDFTRLVVVALIVAAPLAYLAMQRWLQDFAYHIDISWPIFLMAGLTALLIAWLTVSYQSMKAALADPVKSLRYE